MGSFQNGNNWLIDYMDGFQATEYIWSTQLMGDQKVSSARFWPNVPLNKENSAENPSLKKRARIDSSAGAETKAFRGKMRRDRLNDRFLELCSILMLERSPNTDKVVILRDAAHLLNRLRNEVKKLKEKNVILQDSIRSLKAEKMEMREEKLKLKLEKEKIERVMKCMSTSSPFAPQPSFYATTNSKIAMYPLNYPPPMWQWVPAASLDTSQDHVLRPPVA